MNNLPVNIKLPKELSVEQFEDNFYKALKSKKKGHGKDSFMDPIMEKCYTDMVYLYKRVINNLEKEIIKIFEEK